jgi:hypothetical protein
MLFARPCRLFLPYGLQTTVSLKAQLAEGGVIIGTSAKRPSRDDYVFGSEKNDPILQVINTLGKATAAGGISKGGINGRHGHP